MIFEMIMMAGVASAGWTVINIYVDHTMRKQKIVDVIEQTFVKTEKHSKMVQMISGLIDEDPEGWTRTGINTWRHIPAGILVCVSSKFPDTTKQATVTVLEKSLDITRDEEVHLINQLAEVAKRRKKAENDKQAKELAQRILDYKAGVLAEPGLGDSRAEEPRALEYQPVVPSGYLIDGQLFFDEKAGRVIQVMPRGTGQLVLDETLRKRYSQS